MKSENRQTFRACVRGTRPAGIIKSQKQPLLLTPWTNLLSAGTRFVVQWPSTRPPSTESWRRTLVTTIFLPFPHILHHPRPRYVIVLVYSVICGFYYLRLLFALSRTARCAMRIIRPHLALRLFRSDERRMLMYGARFQLISFNRIPICRAEGRLAELARSVEALK